MDSKLKEIQNLSKEQCIVIASKEGIKTLIRSSLVDNILRMEFIPLEECTEMELQSFLMYESMQEHIKPSQDKTIRSKDYKIFTKDDYIKYNLSDKKSSFISKEYIKILNDEWDKLSKDFNFIIGVWEENNLMFCSVEYFNNNILI